MRNNDIRAMCSIEVFLYNGERFLVFGGTIDAAVENAKLKYGATNIQGWVEKNPPSPYHGGHGKLRLVKGGKRHG